MEPVIFQPIVASNMFVIFLIIAILGAAFLVFGIIKNQKVTQLLGFIAFIIFGSSAFMNNLANSKIADVTIYENAIETAYGKASFGDLISSEISTVNPPSNSFTLKGTNQQRYLIIKEKGGNQILLGEANYEIDSMKVVLDERVFKFNNR